MSLVTLNTHNTKATYKREHLTGSLLTVSEGKSVIILEVSLVAGRQGVRRVTRMKTENKPEE